jgi:uncharacterized membrane protein
MLPRSASRALAGHVSDAPVPGRRGGTPNLLPRRLLRAGQVHHPAVLEEAIRRNKSFQLRIADLITGFAGSMSFVFIHAALFAVWMLVLEKSPWPTLTLVVSLEAIFLSTFVMIGQNRQAAFQQAKADHDFQESELELKTNTELTREIHRLTGELHRRVLGAGSGSPGNSAPAT